jgi:hypothetical protein
VDQITVWVYKQHDIPEELDVNSALLVLSERLNTANNVVKSLDRYVALLEKDNAKLEAFKAEQEIAKAKRLELLNDLF